MKNFWFYPKGFITSAQSWLNTGLQQSHLITNTACRTIDPNNQWRVSRKCYKHRSQKDSLRKHFSSGIVQRFFNLWNRNSSQSYVQHTRINAEWSLAELPVSKETVLLRWNERERARLVKGVCFGRMCTMVNLKLPWFSVSLWCRLRLSQLLESCGNVCFQSQRFNLPQNRIATAAKRVLFSENGKSRSVRLGTVSSSEWFKKGYRKLPLNILFKNLPHGWSVHGWRVF